MHSASRVLAISLLVSAWSGTAARAADLRPETVAAYDRYVSALETQLEPRFQGKNFLWFENDAPARDELRKGKVVVRPAKGNGSTSIPGGLIQHWTGAIFVPGATLKTALSVAQDYDHHGQLFNPEIQDAKIRSHQGDEFQVHMRIALSKLLVSGVYSSEHQIRYTSLGDNRAFSRAHTTHLAELANPGKPDERELAPGQDRGLLWRLNNYWFYEERDGGVYITADLISLTRDIPLGMGMILGPLFNDVPRETLELRLTQTQKAVASRAGR